MSELFDPKSVTVDSPCKKWVKKHSISTLKSPEIDPPWAAWSGGLDDALNKDNIGYGQTEDDALVDWAKENGVRLWNEE